MLLIYYNYEQIDGYWDENFINFVQAAMIQSIKFCDIRELDTMNLG